MVASKNFESIKMLRKQENRELLIFIAHFKIYFTNSRRKIADSNVDYTSLMSVYNDNKTEEGKLKNALNDKIKGLTEEDISDLVKMVEEHLEFESKKTAKKTSKKVSEEQESKGENAEAPDA